MIADIVSTFFVLAGLVIATAFVSTQFDRELRPWIWFALAEYMVAGGAQLVWSLLIVQGGDAVSYVQVGERLAQFLDVNFSWAARELWLLILQKPCAFDNIVDVLAGSNTGSMNGVAAFLVFFFRSTISAQLFLAGLSMFGAITIFRTCREAEPELDPVTLFAAIVLFPSVAFWTSAVHKESMCLIGMGLIFAAWRGLRLRRFRALVYAPIGLGIILLFRAPALPPLVLGLVVYLAYSRLQKARGADAVIVGPIVVAVGLAGLALAMIAVTQFMPTLALNQLSDTMTKRQESWTSQQDRGGSTVDDDGGVPDTFAGQLMRLPLGLSNALFRPQFFDVHNVASLIAAIEMTFITWLVIRALRKHGVRGLFVRVQRSPLLLMCTVITLVGCSFVGLVTLNLGSLARYRVPFLPFYGALVTSLSPLRKTARDAAVTAVEAVDVRARTALARARRWRPRRAVPEGRG